MRIFLLIMAVFFFFGGVVYWSTAATSIHQIYSGVLLLISAIFLSGAGIVDAINKLQTNIQDFIKSK